MCRSEKRKAVVNNVETELDEEVAFQVAVIGAVKGHHDLPRADVKINGYKERIIIDSGATANVIDCSTYERIGRPKLTKTSVTIFPYGSRDTKLPVMGTFSTTVESKNAKIVTDVLVINMDNCESLFSYTTSKELGLIRIINQTNTKKPSISSLSETQEPCLGKLKDYQASIPIDPNIKPVAQPPRRIPFNLRDIVKEEIQCLLAADIIEEVSGPTPWVSPTVLVPKKNGKYRLCVDMRVPNQAVIRERYPMPTFDEILHEMNGSKWFSKIDLEMGFHQIELAEDSRSITTFACHLGLFRYKRLMFGISCAPEMYQHIIRMTLQGCPGVQNVADDIIVFGKTKAEHDHCLTQVLERLQNRGLTVNKDKCQFHMREISFLGHHLSEQGSSADGSKIKAITEAREPQNAQEVRSFLGLVNFCARYIPNLATISEPLRRLTRNKEKFIWGPEQNQAFKKLKSCLTTEHVMAYYQTDADTMVIVDASPVGVGAVITQKQSDGSFKPVAYASRALTDTERRYSQTEREALAVVWGCERFHLYLLGKRFTLVTDHKPLEMIYRPGSKPPARIERWALRLQPYTFEICYKPGPKNVADALSCLISPEQTSDHTHSNLAEEYVYFVARSAVPRAMTAKNIEQASAEDPELSAVRKAVRTEDWSNIPTSYTQCKEEICVKGKLLLRGSRIIIPTALRKEVLNLAHQGHQGIIKTKQRLRTKVWWPGIDKQVTSLVESCIPCQINGKGFCPEETHSTPLPEGPWKEVAIDIVGEFPTGEYVVVLIDYYSRWPELLVTESVTSRTIIKWLQGLFACHGLPDIIKSDNGPQFTSSEFADFLSSHAIHHHRVTPYWPVANGLVERLNRTLLKTARCATAEGRDWRESLLDFLVAYRTTPQTTTGITPAYAMFNREIRTKLPELNQTNPDPKITIQEHDSSQKRKSKQYADQSRHCKTADLHEGDKVFVKQRKKNKLTANFGTTLYKVVSKDGNSVLLEHNGRQIRRNVTHLKKWVGESPDTPVHYTEEESEDEDIPHIPTVPQALDPATEPPMPPAEPEPNAPEPGNEPNVPEPGNNHGYRITRSGRQCRPPTRLDL
jgi:hypothetical protein